MPNQNHQIVWVNAHFLVVVEKSEKHTEDWKDFLANQGNISVLPETMLQNRDKPSQRLAENIWLIELKTDLPFLAELSKRMKGKHRVKLLPFDCKPDWIFLDDTNPLVS